MNKRLVAALIMLFSSFPAWAYEPSEEEISTHRAAVYQLASDYIKSNFELDVTDESQFLAVRFDSKRLWGDFEARVEDLGHDWFVVHGWVSARGLNREEVKWTVVLKYKLEDPEAWRYRRLDIEYRNDPVFKSWRFGHTYRSVPFITDIAQLMETSS